jgi:hypothetical protein
MIPTHRLPILLAISLEAAAALVAHAQPTPSPKPQPDVLILQDDERLIGHLVRASGSSVLFKSDLLGEVTVDWSKVKELHTSGRYAVLEKGTRLGRHSDTSNVPKGPLDATGQTIVIHPEPGAAARSIPVANSENVVEEAAFKNEIEHNPGLLEAWNGAVTAAAAVVEATQQSRAFSGGIHLVRAIPAQNWLAARDRTTLDFSASEGFVSQPNTPRVKTEIVHGDAERDEYFTGSRIYGFGQAIFDHNYSQGLDLQQNYGGGIGWTTIKRADLTLDVKSSVSYIRQEFQTAALDHSLVASTFAESLTRRFPRGMTLLESISATPTWNIRKAWLAAGGASFAAPVYKRLTFTIGLQDNFLNDPPPGFHKNSFQATTGLTYTLR